MSVIQNVLILKETDAKSFLSFTVFTVNCFSEEHKAVQSPSRHFLLTQQGSTTHHVSPITGLMKGLQQLRRYIEPCDYTTNKFRVTQLLRFGTVCGFTKCLNLRRVVFVKTAEKKNSV